MPFFRQDISGRKFGKLTIIEPSHREKGKWLWRCICECGNDKYFAISGDLKSGNTTSCGCLRGNALKMSDTALYQRWYKIRARCKEQKNKDYPRYGGRGIKICSDWSDRFENFVRDMGYPPEKHEIDRIDNNGNYEPGNCRWVTSSINNNNRSSNILITAFGETLNITQWAHKMGINRETLGKRIRTGNLTIEEALTIKGKRKHGNRVI